MLIVATISALILTANARIYEINEVFNSEAELNRPILQFDMIKTGYIKDINLEIVSNEPSTDDQCHQINYKLREGPNGQQIGAGNSSQIINASQQKNGKGLFGLYLDYTTQQQETEVDYPIIIKGTVHIVHNYGELSPPQYRAYQYNSIALFISLIMSILWCIFMYRYRRTLVKHHYAIGAIIWILTIETLISYFKLMYVNINGYDIPFMDHLGTQAEVIRQTVARLFLILISLGWGITTSDQEISKNMVSNLLKLGLIYYFLGSFLEHFMVEMIRTRNLDGIWIILPIGFMQCILETFIFTTIIGNLSDILIELKKSKQHSKHLHYKTFARALTILLVFAALNVICEWYIRNNLHQYFDYTILSRQCFWHFNFILMTIIVMILWRPNKSSKYYAFVEQIPTQEQIDNDMTTITEEMDIDYDKFKNDTMHIGYNEEMIAGDSHSMSTARFEIGDLDESDPEIQTENEHNYKFGDMDGGSLEYDLDLHDSDHYDVSDF